MSILYVLELSKKIVVSVIEKSWARAIDKENIFASTRDRLDSQHPLVEKIKISLRKQLKQNQYGRYLLSRAEEDV